VGLIACCALACTDGNLSPAKRADDGSSTASVMVDAAVTAGSIDAGGALAVDVGASVMSYQALIDNLSWHSYDATLDPLRSHQPAELSCAASATFLEYGSFEVDTTRCNYVLSEHPALLALAAGTQVKMEILYYDLAAPEPAEAHLALLFGDALQWETHIPIPKAGDVIEVSFAATRTLALGDPIRLHLHNHGGNSYMVVSVQALVPGTAP
jgi:hypothetical protein